MKKTAFLNGVVYVGGEGQMKSGANSSRGLEPEAILVEGDKIRAVGSSQEIKALAGEGATEIDLGGRRVSPGFVDSHNHVLSGAELLTGVNCFGLKTIQEVQEAVARKAEDRGPGEWVTGAGWIESQFSDGRMPNRHDLDKAAPRNPVVLTRLFGMSWVNSAALRAAGIGKGYTPEVGRVDLDDDGEPTGILRDGAERAIRRAMSEREGGKSGLSLAERLHRTESLVKLSLREYLKYGITSVLDPGANADLMRAYASLRAKGELPLRVTAMPAWHGLSAIFGEREILSALEAGLQPGLGDEWFRLGGMKMAIDGGLGSRTALMHEPWKDFTRSTVPLRLDINKLGGYVAEAHDAGWGVGIHCCGDLAQDLAVSHIVSSCVRRKPLPHYRHHIIHGYYPTEYALRAMAEHDIALSAQPSFIYVEGDIYPTAVDESRLPGFKPLRTYLDRGIRIAINTDVFSGPYNPFVVLYGAVARKTVRGLDFGQAEALTVSEALAAFSAGGSYLAYRDKECGAIEPGRMADLAILDRDILKAPAEELLNCRVDATVLGGNLVYLREGSGFHR